MTIRGSTNEKDGSTRVICNSDALTTAQVAMTSAAAQIIAANASRKFLEITNSGAAAVFIGATSGVTVSTGHSLAAGAKITLCGAVCTAAVFGICGTTSTVTYLEF